VLHDHLQQLLLAAKLKVAVIRNDGPGQLETALDELQELLDTSLDASRTLTAQLSPPILHERGLIAALSWLARWMRDKHNLTVELQLAADAEPADETTRILLFEIARELLLNVVKYAEVETARLTLTRLGRDRVEICVEDEGLGFDLIELDANDRSSGGFGLASVRRRLEFIGGSLSVESVPGDGTCVRVRAPSPESDIRPSRLRPGSQAPLPACSAGQPMPPPGERLRILLADDHEYFREGLANLLQMYDCLEIVAEADDGESAIELAGRLQPDIAILDIDMPRLNGIEACRRITAALPKVRVVGLSLHDEEDIAHAVFEAGGSAYFCKGGPLRALIDLLVQWNGE
jgi:CheY-like chemotaxis protein/anti-sigma regulatory factor (Ser/Thr protein kinase)